MSAGTAPVRPGPPRSLCFLAFLSGAACLGVEVAASRLVTRALGSSSFGVASTLAGILGGMGVGAWLAERFVAGKLRPFQGFAAAELSALVAAVTFRGVAPEIHEVLPPPAADLALLAAVVALAVPWGASFPFLVQASGAASGSTRGLGVVYGLSSVGGGAGALAAGFLLLPALGEWGTVLVCAGLELLVALGALAMDRRLESRGPAPGDDSLARATRERLSPGLGLFIGLAGALVIYWEGLWTRLLTLTIGSTVYSFSVISSGVVLGLGAASLLWRGERHARSGGWALGLAAAVLQCALVLVVPFLPDAYLAGVRGLGGSPLACGIVGAGLFAFVPGFLLGSLFPWGASRAPARSGTAYALSSLGCAAGAFAGHLLQTRVGGLLGLYALGCVGLHLLALLGLCFMAPPRRAAALLTVLGLGGSAALWAWGFSSGRLPWEPRRLLSGVYQWPLEDLLHLPLEESLSSRVLLAVEEGRDVVVSVEEERTANTFYVRGNGKVEGSVPIDRARPSLADLPTQILLGALPAEIHRRTPDRRALLIGLGSGVSLGALAAPEGGFPAEKVDAVELEPAFLRALLSPAARERLGGLVPASLLEPGNARAVRLHFGDARRLLSAELAEERFDAIVSQPSEPWIPGAAPLFTLELFRRAAAHLREGGRMFQWLQLYKLDEEAFLLALRTFRRVFPTVYVLRPPGTGEVILVGGKDPLPFETLAALPVSNLLVGAGLEEPLDRLALIILGPNGVDELVGLDPALPVSTDNHGRLEYLGARTLHAGPELARGLLARLQAAGGRDPISRYLPERLRGDRAFLRRLAERNAWLGDFPEALALLAGDGSEEASRLRAKITSELEKP